MAYDPKDYYFFKAKKENFAARSVFKLEEIDQRFRILRANQKVLDLGAAPGSWSQYAAKKVGPKGRVLGIDLQPIKITLQNAAFETMDIRAIDWQAIFDKYEMQPPFDVVLSDMAPKTTGVRLQDQMRSLELCEIALETAKKYLKRGGTFICKMFHSDEFENYRKLVRAHFEKVDILRPKSTRRESKEVFFIATQFKKAPKSEIQPKPEAEDA